MRYTQRGSHQWDYPTHDRPRQPKQAARPKGLNRQIREARAELRAFERLNEPLLVETQKNKIAFLTREARNKAHANLRTSRVKDAKGKVHKFRNIHGPSLELEARFRAPGAAALRARAEEFCDRHNVPVVDRGVYVDTYVAEAKAGYTLAKIRFTLRRAFNPSRKKD